MGLTRSFKGGCTPWGPASGLATGHHTLMSDRQGRTHATYSQCTHGSKHTPGCSYHRRSQSGSSTLSLALSLSSLGLGGWDIINPAGEGSKHATVPLLLSAIRR